MGVGIRNGTLTQWTYKYWQEQIRRSILYCNLELFVIFRTFAA